MTGNEINLNLAARFYPMVQDNRDRNAHTTPCIEIGGVQVYAYFDEGVLRVSLDYETADLTVIADDGVVPTEISVGGSTVWRG